MDLIYTDKNRLELGVLHNYEVDFDTTGTMDFQITVAIKNNVLQGGYYWYIDGTEYGGKVDAYKVITSTDEIQYTGRNFRGMLCKKIIEPPAGQNYKIISGKMDKVIGILLSDASMQDIFVVDECSIYVSDFKFNRYISTYDGICALAKRYGLVPRFIISEGKVHISLSNPTDYSDSMEYTQDDIDFMIQKTYANVNHLICLGQGELKDRTVIHLYVDKDGNVGDKQSFFGEEEIVEIYENTGESESQALRAAGVARLEELKNTDKFEVTAPDIDLKIGDIIGGMELVTDTYVCREIVNIIAKIDDRNIDLEYKVGEDGTSSSRSGGSSSGSSGGSVYNLPVAGKDRLGGVMIGENLEIGKDGKLSAKRHKFADSETIEFTNKDEDTIEAYVKNHSITGDKLEEDYLEKIQSETKKAEDAAKKAEDIFNSEIPNFFMDLKTGHLMYDGKNFVFKVDINNGHLNWEVSK